MSEYSKQYYQKNKEAILRRKKERNAETKKLFAQYMERKRQGDMLSRNEELFLRETHARYIKKCSYEINIYAYRSMKRMGESFEDEIRAYYVRFPFESFGEPCIKRELWKRSIWKHHAEYDDCYAAGVLAYLYSIHRCAALHCEYVPSYIQKMVRIYIHCAHIVHCDIDNICRVNGFRRVSLDSSRKI